jgi:GNAT superfamily N-acetyltransferase
VNHRWYPEFYTESDVDELAALCQAQPGKAAAITPEYIRWQHSANPAGLAQVGLAKENGSGRIIGVLWLLPIYLQLSGQEVLGSQSMYALVHPDYRQQGVFSTLVDFCNEAGQQRGYNFAFGFPNPNSYPVFVRNLGWSDIGQARLYIRPLNAKRLIKTRFRSHLLQNAICAVANPAEHLLFQPHSLSAEASQVNIEDIGATSTGVDNFWARVRKKYPVMVIRNTHYLNWRYKTIPDRHYQLWAARLGKEVVAIIALRCVSIKGIACGMVVDFLVEEGERGRLGGEALLQQAAAYFHQQDMDLAGCLVVPHADEVRSLRRQGYITCPRELQPQPFRVIIHLFNDSLQSDSLYDLKSWFLTMGDFDAI